MKQLLKKILMSVKLLYKISNAKDVQFGQNFKNKKWSEADTKEAYQIKKYMELEKIWINSTSGNKND